MSEEIPRTALFNGEWVGESMGVDSPAHLWRIRQDGRNLYIYTTWEGPGRPSGYFWALISDDPRCFRLGDDANPDKHGTLLDNDHFVIPNWDTNDIRASTGPAFDVVFSRPGLAEMSARAIWRHAQEHGLLPNRRHPEP